MDHNALPTDSEVRAAIAHLLEQAAAGPGRPTVTALAARLGISRQRLYRQFRPMVDELLAAASAHEEPRRRRIRNRDGELAEQRRGKEDLRRHVELYEEVIRELTVENHRLRRELENQAEVTRIGHPRHA